MYPHVDCKQINFICIHSSSILTMWTYTTILCMGTALFIFPSTRDILLLILVGVGVCVWEGESASVVVCGGMYNAVFALCFVPLVITCSISL